MKTPTRMTDTNRSLIDVVMTSSTLVDNCSVLESSISDHSLVEVILNIKLPKVEPKYVTVRSYSRYNVERFLEKLSFVPWHMVDFFYDIDFQVEAFNTLFLDVLNRHAPIKRIKIKSRPNPYVTLEIKQLMKTRDFWHKKAIKTNDRFCWNRYRFFRQAVKRELRLTEKIHVRNKIANCRGNTNATWKILNRCMSRNKNKACTGTMEDQQTLANKFNKYFTSVGELTAIKANLIAKEQFLNLERSSSEEEMGSILLEEKERFMFQTVKEKYVESVIKSLSDKA